MSTGVINLDGNGKSGIIYTVPSGDFVLTRAATCSIKPRFTFKLSDMQRYQAARDSGTGFFYSSFDILLDTVSLFEVSASVPAQTYTGKALKPATTVKAYGRTLKAGTDYALAYSNNTNAGTAKVTLMVKGDYVGTRTISFTINKANSSIKAKKKAVTLKASKLKKKAQKVANLTVTCDKGKATYKNVSKNKTAKKFKVAKKTGKLTVPKGTKAGTYTVKVKVAVKSGANYKKLTKTVSFKVKVKGASSSLRAA